MLAETSISTGSSPRSLPDFRRRSPLSIVRRQSPHCHAHVAGAGAKSRRRAGSWEQFTLLKLNGTGAIANGDSVALRSVNGRYVTVGSNGILDVTGSAVGASQTFTATLGTQ